MAIQIPFQSGRQVAPTGSSGGVFADRGLGDTSGPLRSVAGYLGQLGNIFEELDRRQIAAEQNAELINGQAQADKLINDHKLFLESGPDVALDDNGNTTYKENWNKTLKDIKKISGGFVWKDSQAAMENWVGRSEPSWQFKNADMPARISMSNKIVADLKADLDGISSMTISSDTVHKRLGIDSRPFFTADPRVDQIIKEEKGGKPDLQDDIINRTALMENEIEKAVAGGHISAEQGVALAKSSSTVLGRAHDEMTALVRVDGLYDANKNLPYDVARANVNAESNLTNAERSGVLTRLANDEAIRQKQIDAQQKAESQSLWDSILDNTFTPESARATSLDADEQHKFNTWNNSRIDRLNKGETVVTDRAVFTRLKDLAVAINDDRASRKVAQDALIDAAMQGKINDDDNTIVDNMIRTSYTAARKGAESNARFVGIKQIVGVEPDTTITPGEAVAKEIAKLRGLAQTESEKLRWSLYDDYMEDMREWFEEPKNKDKVKESYRVTKSKAAQYKAISDLSDAEIGAFRSLERAPGGARGFGVFGEIEETAKEGDTVSRGGKQYRVVGFDTDGEPLVEEIK